jgi:hypothetical protein
MYYAFWQPILVSNKGTSRPVCSAELQDRDSSMCLCQIEVPISDLGLVRSSFACSYK